MTALLVALCLAGPVADVSFYCPCKACCGPGARGITASGKRVRPGMVAAPASLPFGTRLRLGKLGTYTVEDRGGAIKGRKLDVFVRSHAEALRRGRRTVDMQILSYGKGRQK